MKREDLRAGQEYLVCPGSNWNTMRGRGHLRVRLLGLDPWDRDGLGHGRQSQEAVTETGTHVIPENFYPVAGGQGVLVEVLDKASGEHHCFGVAQLGAIRGEWLTAWKQYQDNVEAERAEDRARRARADRAAAEAKSLAEALGGSTHAYQGAVHLTLGQARDLLARLEAAEHGVTQ